MSTVLEIANATDYSDCFAVLSDEQLASGPTIGKRDIDHPRHEGYTISAANPGSKLGRPKKEDTPQGEGFECNANEKTNHIRNINGKQDIQQSPPAGRVDELARLYAADENYEL